jgi:hypothetical protein
MTCLGSLSLFIVLTLKNTIHKFKGSFLFYVFKIKCHLVHDYIQSVLFLSQGSFKLCHVFKMSTCGDVSRMENVQ